ncbi:MAG: YdcH family protein [Albidovulum sp.]|uniref:YdcH family protein n=1 Tax=Albidovulum sp. TaxID=1872424 RepID=UPI003C832EDF
MSHTPHELHEEFPAEADRIHEMKVSNAHFARLAEEYHAINRDVHRAETGIEPVDSLAETEMRKKRAHLKDEIARMLAGA